MRSLKQVVTLRFDKNVGTVDRLARMLSGVGVASLGWFMAWPTWAAVALTGVGLLWCATGVLSKCSIYYMLGYSTCPISGQARAD